MTVAPSPAPRGRAWPALIALLGALTAIAVAYEFFLTAGFSDRKLPEKAYYNRLADGFLAGQLHILEPPSPQLLAQANPQDFATSRHLWRVWDASLYDGKFYFYWGPVPALLADVVKIAAGRDVLVGDRQIVAVFVVGRLLVGAAILYLVLRWLFPSLSAGHVLPAFVLFGLANPYPYLLGRPGVYEAAIESAQFFLLLGLLAALVALRRASDRSDELPLFAAAGTAWALAVGCRVSLLFAIGALVVLTGLSGVAWDRNMWRRLTARALALGVPLALMLLALGYYNYARFGSVFDFGTEYMLTKQQFAPQGAFVLPNLHSYLLRRYTVVCEFPFLGAPFFARALTPAWANAAAGWIPQEPVVGLLVAIPGLAFATLALGAAASRIARARAATALDANGRLFVWLVLSAASIWALAAAPTLGVWTATMRYQSDVVSSALLLATMGYWAALTRLRARGSLVGALVVTVLAASLLVYSLAVGLALGFQGGYYRAIRAHNPTLHAKLVRTFSLCEKR